MNDLDLIQQFRESHHAIARMFAMGLTASMIRRQTGISTRRLTLLWNSPTFQNLTAYYARKAMEVGEEQIQEFGDLAIANLLKAERMLGDKIDAAEDAEEFLPTRDLLGIIADRADRFGYSKHSQVTVKHDFANALERAVLRSGKGEAMKQIEGKAVEVPSLPNASDLAAQPLPTQAQLVEHSSLTGPLHSSRSRSTSPTRPNLGLIAKRRRIA